MGLQGNFMIIREIYAKTILSRSKVFDYVINPYIGCEHGCIYCYARYIKRFTGHGENWGEFVDVKVNAAHLLQHEVRRKRAGRVWISGLCDPYQPIEAKYGITRRCLEILLKRGWPVSIQTKSTLVLRDLELLQNRNDVEVILTITTADDNIRRIFEPNAPSIPDRLKVLERMHSLGIRTSVMIGPILPNAEGLIEAINGNVDQIYIDKMNYHYANWAYEKYGLKYAMTEKYFKQKKIEFEEALKKIKVPYEFEY
ncbi:MAG: radical SAM protein [Candidatus Bathyarchaeota archaeon]|nr:radical SAM protein [Candidatus Bathyarchaeota archaeon]